jgi:hypothetical protein
VTSTGPFFVVPVITPPPVTPPQTPRVTVVRTLVLTNPTILPGQTTTADGQGCVPNSPVVLAIDGHQVATTTADSNGDFSAPLTPPQLGVGHLTVTATCGSTQLTTLLAMVTTVKVSTPEGGAAVFCVFVLLGAVLLRGQFTSNVTRRRKRRRTAGAA